MITLCAQPATKLWPELTKLKNFHIIEKKKEEVLILINNRLEEIKKRNLTISTRSAEPEVPIDFGKIKLGLKTLDDAVVKLGDFRKINSQMGDKAYIQ